MEPDTQPDVRRHLVRLVLGILACGVVIALCVAALVFLLDRFTAKPAKDCARLHCRSAAAAVGG